ncbi:4416_t:CDS:2 [Ambispora gerdemannii]|uniref:4416_t:CDS:1 n=1 Tax=Ambispora gerdemannii TaxID=144530 RepID=A0A9N8UZZ2_9GLOM|nr:4416_t:CDS:2 [Ambispora gerdemannii]
MLIISSLNYQLEGNSIAGLVSLKAVTISPSFTHLNNNSLKFYNVLSTVTDRSLQEPQNFYVEWPPEFDFEVLFKNRKRNKTPNDFILFRTKYLEGLQRCGVNRKMTIVSKMASAAWKKLSEDRRNKYKSISYKASLYWAKWDPKRSKRSGIKKLSHKLNKRPNAKNQSDHEQEPQQHEPQEQKSQEQEPHEQQKPRQQAADTAPDSLNISKFFVDFTDANFETTSIFLE